MNAEDTLTITISRGTIYERYCHAIIDAYAVYLYRALDPDLGIDRPNHPSRDEVKRLGCERMLDAADRLILAVDRLLLDAIESSSLKCEYKRIASDAITGPWNRFGSWFLNGDEAVKARYQSYPTYLYTTHEIECELVGRFSLADWDKIGRLVAEVEAEVAKAEAECEAYSN